MIVSGTCPVCQKEWTWNSANKGRKRVFCSKMCAVRRWKRTDTPRCSTYACGGAVVTKNGLCTYCYRRLKRNGTVVPVRPMGQRRVTQKGYVSLSLPAHPLAAPSHHGRIMEHRVVLYEKLGPGPQHCYWCSEQLTWDTLVVDHLNETKHDNSASNLVASCNQCNRARGQQLYFLSGLSDVSFATFIRVATEYHKRAQRPKEQRA
jgi:hypothetical protein